MKRISLFALLLLAACDRAAVPTEKAATVEVWQANARDRLCLDGNRAGFIVYGEGDRNCSARGRAIRSDTGASITPDGDSKCVFVMTQAGEGATLRAAPAEAGSCDYYCAPGARIDGLRLTRAPAGTSATDLAGDRLC